MGVNGTVFMRIRSFRLLRIDPMKSAGFCLAGVLCVIGGGCAGPAVNGQKGRLIYEEGYRQGVSRNIGSMVEALNGNDFPYLGETWSQPLVQDVCIPAHIENGFFYPRHFEPVIITPGEWKKSGAFPLSAGAQTPGLPAYDITPLPGENYTEQSRSRE